MAHQKLHFVIGGAQKSGTCTLDRLLRLHGNVQMAKVKETHFFDDEGHDWRAPDYGELEAHFPPFDGRKRGEATPITLYWRPAMDRLADYNSDIKLVLMLRDPVARAFSNWRMQYAIGREPLTFAEAIRGGRDRVRAEADGLHRYFSYVERGFYGAQLAHALDRLPKHNIHCEIFEEFFADRAAGLERLAQFLDIGPFADDLPDIHTFAAPEISYPSTLTDEDAAYLSVLYRDDFAELEGLLGRPIPVWRNSQGRGPG